ncbi:hypothetical protein [Rhizobium leguminosarum]|uniref:hypothetical protein n=1 Tax=Rhizobium leguminosarum TaxID=384 RepID=UPI003ECC67E7
MARWTDSYEDMVRIARVGREIPPISIVAIALTNGKHLEGVIRRIDFGNNAGDGGWRYYGEVEIEGPDGRFVIDYLDIEAVHDLWARRKDDYARAGLIQIRDFPE